MQPPGCVGFIFSLKKETRTLLGEAEHNRCLRSKRKALPCESLLLRQINPMQPLGCVEFIFFSQKKETRTLLGEAEHNRCLRSKRKALPCESLLLRQINPMQPLGCVGFIFFSQKKETRTPSAKPNTIGVCAANAYAPSSFRQPFEALSSNKKTQPAFSV